MLEYNKERRYCWVGKFLINWSKKWDGYYLSLCFYPDYENCKYWFNVKIDLGRQK